MVEILMQKSEPSHGHITRLVLQQYLSTFFDNMSANPRPHQFSGISPADVRLSVYEYYDMIDALLDDRVSAATLLKFKELFRYNSLQLLIIPVIAFPPAWIANKWLQGGVYRGMASSRFNLMGMAIFYPLTLYYAATQIRPPHKLYTEILTDEGDDGHYVREMLRLRKPGLWNFISPQLQDLGYNYNEAPSVSFGTEFPATFFSIKDL